MASKRLIKNVVGGLGIAIFVGCLVLIVVDIGFRVNTGGYILGNWPIWGFTFGLFLTYFMIDDEEDSNMSGGDTVNDS